MAALPVASRQVRFLALLFSENSPFRTAAAISVSEIELNWPRAEFYFDSSMRGLKVGLEMFEGEAKEVDLARVLFSACAPFVRKVFVINVPEDETYGRHSLNNSYHMSFSIVEMLNKYSSGDIERH